MRIYIADFETTPFNYNAIDNYHIYSRFLCAKLVHSTIYRNPNKKKWYYFDLERNTKKKLEVLYNFIMYNSSMSNPSIFYFHNLHFDLAMIYKLLPREYDYDIIKNNSKILALRVFKKYKRYSRNGKEREYKKTLFELRDSLTILLSSVEKIGNSLGYVKKDIDYNIKEITKEYIYYCRRDIRVIEKAFKKLLNFMYDFYGFDINISNLPLSLPALSKRIFHKLLYNNGINRVKGKQIYNLLYDNSNRGKEYEKILREYYYGGRVEVFDFNPCLTGVYNDFNSHYPAIMYENEFPLQPYSREKCNNNEICWYKWKENKNIFGIECTVNENFDIPLIAIKYEITPNIKKLLFCNGKKRTFLFRKEIEYLFELGLKQKDIIISHVWFCSSYAYIFKDFIEIAYSIKKQYNDNTFEYWLAKIFQNSLYGKFAENKEKEAIQIIHSLQGLSEKELNKISSLDLNSNEYIKRENVIYNQIKTNIVFSMMITALARLKIHKSILKSKKSHYTDSDSIVSKDCIENSNELGRMKPEFTFSKFQALGCKEYVVESWKVIKNPIIKVPIKIINVKMKGFGKLSYDNLNVFVSDYFEPKKQHRLVGFMESFNRKMDKNLVLVYDKFKSSVYDKRWILSDLTTKPFDLDNDNYFELVKNNEFYINKIIEKYKNEI